MPVCYYDPTLGRFVSADAIVPEAGNPQSLNRYAYVKNNPLRYVDPSGHAVDAGGAYCSSYEDMFEAYDALAERTSIDAWRGHEQEYYALRAVLYLKLAEGRPDEEIEATAGFMANAWQRLLINGYHGTEPAIHLAMDAGAQEAYEGLLGLIAGGAIPWQVNNRSVEEVVGDTNIRPGEQGVVDKPFVERYARDMAEGNFDWGRMEEPLEVARLSDGSLVIKDGHHRFIAAQMTGTPIPWDNPKAVFIWDINWWPASDWRVYRWSGR